MREKRHGKSGMKQADREEVEGRTEVNKDATADEG